MLRVCHIITSLEIGGAQTMLARILEAEEARGVEASVISLIPGGGTRPRVEAACPRVFDLGMERRWPDPRVLWRLKNLLREQRPDLVQTWLYHGDILGTIAASMAKVGPVVWNLRCTVGHSLRRISSRPAPFVCAKLSGKPAAIISNSRAGRESHAEIGYHPRRWELIPNGFDLDRLAPQAGAREQLLKELDLPPDRQLIGLVARFHPIKNHALAARIIGELATEFPRAVLLLVGAGLAPGEVGFEGLLRTYGEASGGFLDGAIPIKGLGPRQDIPALMSAFDVLLSSSTHEGFPNVLGEALACGTPCVSTDAGDSRDVVGDAGRVVPVGDAVALRDALAEVLRLDASERIRLGELGRAHMLKQHSIGAIVDRYVSLWEELAGDRGS
jgi:glycosyltransferase involved in cell wall biosynthesis